MIALIAQDFFIIVHHDKKTFLIEDQFWQIQNFFQQPPFFSIRIFAIPID